MTDFQNIYVLYHANCFDGTGARYAAWKYFGNDAEYIPVQYGQPFPEEVKTGPSTAIYILDFSYTRKILDDLYNRVGYLKVLDHHKTAEEELRGAEYAMFDMERSGAVMAWQFFFPDSEVPKLLRHVQDGDLWKFKMMHTEEVRCALPLLEGSMQEWDKCAADARELNRIVEMGKTIQKANDIKIENTVKYNVKVLPYRGYRAGVYNTTVLTSEIGNAVYKDPMLGVDFSLSYFIDKEGNPFVSFRSTGETDISVLAKELGGGGHKGAAGAKVTWKFLQDLYSGVL